MCEFKYPLTTIMQIKSANVNVLKKVCFSEHKHMLCFNVPWETKEPDTSWLRVLRLNMYKKSLLGAVCDH